MGECTFPPEPIHCDEHGRLPALCSNTAADLGRRLEAQATSIKTYQTVLARLEEEKAQAQAKKFPIQTQRGAKPHPLRIPWSVAEKAYSVYAAQYGRSQSLERLAERGGFGPGEMDMFLPNWRQECDEIEQLKSSLARAEAREAATTDMLTKVRRMTMDGPPNDATMQGIFNLVASFSPDAGRALAAEVETLREVARAAEPILREYARKNPRWNDGSGAVQDPMGVHAALDALGKRGKEGE